MSDTRANLSNAELDALIESMVDRIEQLQTEVERLRDRDVNDEAYTSNLEAEVERLKGGIEKWLREGVNKYDTCPHGKMWYEGCEACDESYFAALIAPQEQSE